MKKKLMIIIPIAVLLIVGLCIAAVVFFSGYELEDGRVVVCDNNVVVFVGKDGEFWQMNPTGISKGQIEKLETGDKVTVLRSTVTILTRY